MHGAVWGPVVPVLRTTCGIAVVLGYPLGAFSCEIPCIVVCRKPPLKRSPEGMAVEQDCHTSMWARAGGGLSGDLFVLSVGLGYGNQGAL